MDITASFERMMDYLTPSELKKDLSTEKRVRMFILAQLFGPLIALTIPASLALGDTNAVNHLLVPIVVIGTSWPFLLLLKLFPGAYTQLALISVCKIAFVIFWGIYHYGGTSSPLLVWVVLIPFLTFHYIGANTVSKVFVILLSAGSLGALYLLYLVQGFHHAYNEHDLVIPGLVSAMGIIFYTYMMSLYYTSIVDDQSKLVREISRHHITTQELRQAIEAAEAAQAVAEQERTSAVLAQAEAERANEAKTAFLARMSHELRTPLNAVIGYSELIIEENKSPRSPEETQDLKRIGSAGKHLLAMVNDILDIAKIETGNIHMYSEPVDLQELIEEVAGTASVLAKANNNRFIVECPDDIGAIMGDATKIRQAILNLLANAAKFTRNGSIILTVSRDVMDGEPWMDIAVTDTGIGISAEEQSRLFTTFSQANKSIGLLYGGSGLGLSLSQNLCRLMGGSISLESTAGVGSTFTIHLPLDLGTCEIPLNIGAPIIFQPDGRRAFDKRAHQKAHASAHGEMSLNELEARPVEHSLTNHLSEQPARLRVVVCDSDLAFMADMAARLWRLGYEPLTIPEPGQVIEVAKGLRPAVIMLSDRVEAVGAKTLRRTFAEDVILRNIPLVRIGDNLTTDGPQKNETVSIYFSSTAEELKDILNQVVPENHNIKALRVASRGK